MNLGCLVLLLVLLLHTLTIFYSLPFVSAIPVPVPVLSAFLSASTMLVFVLESSAFLFMSVMPMVVRSSVLCLFLGCPLLGLHLLCL